MRTTSNAATNGNANATMNACANATGNGNANGTVRGDSKGAMSENTNATMNACTNATGNGTVNGAVNGTMNTTTNGTAYGANGAAHGIGRADDERAAAYLARTLRQDIDAATATRAGASLLVWLAAETESWARGMNLPRDVQSELLSLAQEARRRVRDARRSRAD